MTEAGERLIRAAKVAESMMEPVAYAAFADNGNIRIWSQEPGRVDAAAAVDGFRVEPLVRLSDAEARIRELENLAMVLEAESCGHKARAEAAEAMIAELQRERYELAYAITGGEDAPGLLDSISVEQLVEIARGNHRSMSAEIDRSVAAQARAEAAESQISEIAGHLDSECDSDSILHVIREVQADRYIYKERAAAEEARIAELEADKTALLQAIKHHSGSDHGLMGIRLLVERAEAAEALLKEAGPIIKTLLAIRSVWTDPHNDDICRAARAIHDKIGVKDE